MKNVFAAHTKAAGRIRHKPLPLRSADGGAQV